jgi:hypothetical protein
MKCEKKPGIRDLTDYRVKAIQFPHGAHLLSHLAKIEDEGSFYRIDGTYILDKFKIKSIETIDSQIIIDLGADQIVLDVE